MAPMDGLDRTSRLTLSHVMTGSVHGFRIAVEERSDAILLNDFHVGVQSFLVGVERFIPKSGGIFFIYDLQYPTRIVLNRMAAYAPAMVCTKGLRSPGLSAIS